MYRRNYYNNKIHSDPDFYEDEKKRVITYQNNRYNTDDEFREKKKEYCRNAMRLYYKKKKEQSITNNDN